MKTKRFLAAVLVVFFVSAPAFADESTAGDYFYELGTQFGRGLENIVTSPADIPCTMATDIQDKGGVGSLTGFGKGTVFMLRRMLVGVLEVGTFYLPRGRTIPRVCHKEPAQIASSGV